MKDSEDKLRVVPALQMREPVSISESNLGNMNIVQNYLSSSLLLRFHLDRALSRLESSWRACLVALIVLVFSATTNVHAQESPGNVPEQTAQVDVEAESREQVSTDALQEVSAKNEEPAASDEVPQSAEVMVGSRYSLQ
ncbi:MAG: hypothetical protein K2X29_03865, partial [Candidatus Obscuribacterales bacterium]|nr:hypothetical protein [Candidatus Obscuribacterales bacterium]